MTYIIIIKNISTFSKNKIKILSFLSKYYYKYINYFKILKNKIFKIIDFFLFKNYLKFRYILLIFLINFIICYFYLISTCNYFLNTSNFSFFLKIYS